MDMRLANVGDTPTCIRHNGSSVVDLTWVFPNLAPKILDWRVLDDYETLSDHQYIRFEVQLNKPDQRKKKFVRESYPRWSFNKINLDKFEAAITAHCCNNNPTEITDPENGVKMLMNVITEACDASTPRVHWKQLTSMYWWTKTIANYRKDCIKVR